MDKELLKQLIWKAFGKYSKETFKRPNADVNIMINDIARSGPVIGLRFPTKEIPNSSGWYVMKDDRRFKSNTYFIFSEELNKKRKKRIKQILK
jgi:hypothetical protein